MIEKFIKIILFVSAIAISVLAVYAIASSDIPLWIKFLILG